MCACCNLFSTESGSHFLFHNGGMAGIHKTLTFKFLWNRGGGLLVKAVVVLVHRPKDLSLNPQKPQRFRCSVHL